MNPKTLYRPAADRLGSAASGACAVHCALAPLALTFFPGVLAREFSSPLVHHGLAVFVAVSSLLAFVPGWLKHCQSGVTPATSAPGLGPIPCHICVNGDGRCGRVSQSPGADVAQETGGLYEVLKQTGLFRTRLVAACACQWSRSAEAGAS